MRNGLIRIRLGIAVILIACCGCAPEPKAEQGTGVAAAPPTAYVTPPTQAGPPPFREFWEEHYFQNSKIGHTHGSYFHDVVAGEPVVRIELTGQMVLSRGGQRIEQAMHDVSWETPAGEVRRFRNSMTVAGSAQTTTGVVQGEHALLTLETSGKATTSKIDWPRGTLGEFGVTDWMLRNRPQPGATATFQTFLPFFNQIVGVTLTAKQKEPVVLGAETRQLVRVDTQAVLPGGMKLDSTAWVDDQGEVWKSVYPALQQTTLRTTREQALKPGDAAAAVDLGLATKVPTVPPLVKPYETTLVRYRVRLAEGDAAAVFPSGDSQAVTRNADGSADITVVALRPNSPKASEAVSPPPTDDDLRPNNWIQSDDEAVKGLTVEPGAKITDPWLLALRFEQSLRPRWQTKPLGTSFATAADAARELSGDCTEYAVLLAAMLRSRGIPARTAVGLVYVESEHAFLYHMWTEAYLADRWIPLDAAWGRGGTSAAYLKVAQTNLAGVEPLTAMLSVAQVMGRLKVEVLEQR